VSGEVDEGLARLLAAEVSDGVVAAGFEPAALAILRRKKDGRYLVLLGDPGFEPPALERRELFGLALEQRRNIARLRPDALGAVGAGGGGPAAGAGAGGRGGARRRAGGRRRRAVPGPPQRGGGGGRGGGGSGGAGGRAGSPRGLGWTPPPHRLHPLPHFPFFV